MQKILNWLGLSLKITLRNKNLYISSLLIICVSISVSQFKVEKENEIIGLFADDTELINEIQYNINGQKDALIYSTEDKLKADVLKGNIGSGFVFKITPEEYVDGDDCGGIKAYTSPGYVYLETDKEIVYEALLKCCTDFIISKECDFVFADSDDGLSAEIIDKKNEYLMDGALFDINIMVSESENNEKNEYNTDPLKGIMALMVFLCIFLSYGQNLKGDFAIIEGSLNPKDRIIFRVINSVVVGIWFGGIALFCLGIYSSDNLIENIIKMAFFLTITIVWTNLIGGLIKSQAALISLAQVFLIVQLIICPVIVDLQKYLLPVKFIRYLLPVTYFLV